MAAQLLASGMGRREAASVVAAECRITEHQAFDVCTAVYRAWENDLSSDLARSKAIIVKRLSNTLTRMWAKASPPFAEILKCEDQIAKLLGAYAPIRVAVDTGQEVRKSLLVLVSGLTQEEQDSIVAEQLALEGRPLLLPTSDRSDVAAAE